MTFESESCRRALDAPVTIFESNIAPKSCYPDAQCALHIRDAQAEMSDIARRLNNELRKYSKSIDISMHFKLQNLESVDGNRDSSEICSKT